MEAFTLSLLLLLFIFLLSIFLISKNHRSKKALYPLPPGPRPYPLVGNLLQLGPLKQPHVTFTTFSKIYGPIFSLQLGQVTTIIISSQEYARKLFQKDLTLAGRHEPDAIRMKSHHERSIVWLPPGPRWRSLRRLCTTELFTTQRLDSHLSLRRQKVQELLDFVSKCAKEGIQVEIGRAAFTTTLNLLSRTIFSTDLTSLDSDSSQEFKKTVEHILELAACPNVSDIFPVLTWLDLQGVRKRTEILVNFLHKVFDEQIDNRTKKREEGYTKQNDLLDVLLDSEFGEAGPEFRQLLKSIFLDLFGAGADTSSDTVEWAMAELLQNPVQMEKLLINVWAIGRDKKIWPGPLQFRPERFFEREIDFKGHDFKLIPFGAGRRMCPGLPLAYRMVHLMLGSLLHRFEWKLPEETANSGVDMSEKFGVTLSMAQHLKAIAVPVKGKIPLKKSGEKY